MRPQDIFILLKLITIGHSNWQYRDLSVSLNISISEISESLQRSFVAGLVDEAKKNVYRQSLMEFIQYGLHYVFPQHPGGMVTGMPTAHSHVFYKSKLVSDLSYVWPDENGTIRGLSIQPLYKSVPFACNNDQKLYKLLAGIDIIRVGKTRELKLALEELKKDIL